MLQDSSTGIGLSSSETESKKSNLGQVYLKCAFFFVISWFLPWAWILPFLCNGYSEWTQTILGKDWLSQTQKDTSLLFSLFRWLRQPIIPYYPISGQCLWKDSLGWGFLSKWLIEEDLSGGPWKEVQDTDKAGADARLRCGLGGSLASVRPCRELWSKNNFSELSHLEAWLRHICRSVVISCPSRKSITLPGVSLWGQPFRTFLQLRLQLWF